MCNIFSLFSEFSPFPVLLIMDCCSADGYAATYTELLKKLTGNNEFWIIFIIVILIIGCRLLARRITASSDDTSTDIQLKKEE